jgi:hypothetical protein
MSQLFDDLFPADARDKEIIAAYEASGLTLDDLPYTREFESMAASLRERGVVRDERDLLHRLYTLRKAARLPRLGRGATPPPKTDRDEDGILASLVQDAVGALGRRDQLPYTPEFDRLVERFNAQTGRSLTPHDVWRVAAKVAK